MFMSSFRRLARTRASAMSPYLAAAPTKPAAYQMDAPHKSANPLTVPIARTAPCVPAVCIVAAGDTASSRGGDVNSKAWGGGCHPPVGGVVVDMCFGLQPQCGWCNEASLLLLMLLLMLLMMLLMLLMMLLMLLLPLPLRLPLPLP